MRSDGAAVGFSLLARRAAVYRATMMMKTMVRLSFGFGLSFALSACTDSEGPGGGGGGDDTLPKRGELASDPTIVSATGACSTGGPMSYISIQIAGSDPMGQMNLGTCAATVAGVTAQGTYGEGASCYATMYAPCTVDQLAVVDLVVSNATGGVTTASVVLRMTNSAE